MDAQLLLSGGISFDYEQLWAVKLKTKFLKTQKPSFSSLQCPLLLQ